MTEPKTPQQTAYEKFLAAAFDFMSSKPDARIIILAETPKGLYNFTNDWSVSWCLGVLKRARRGLSRQAMEAARSEEGRRIEREELEAMERSSELVNRRKQ